MRIKDFTDTIRHLTDSFNIPQARRMIAENPALTQEQFKAGGRIGFAKAGIADPANNIEVGQENQELKAKVQELSRIHESEIKELENETFELDELFQQINELQQENQELKTKLERVREEVDKGFQTSSSTYGLDHGVSVMEALSYIEEVLNDA